MRVQETKWFHDALRPEIKVDKKKVNIILYKYLNIFANDIFSFSVKKKKRIFFVFSLIAFLRYQRKKKSTNIYF